MVGDDVWEYQSSEYQEAPSYPKLTLILSIRHHEEFEAARSDGRLVRKSEERILLQQMRQDLTFLQERNWANPRPAATNETQSGIFRTSRESIIQYTMLYLYSNTLIYKVIDTVQFKKAINFSD